MVEGALEPYGVLAVSPKYMTLSSGMAASRGGMHVKPPSPESKNPMGLLSIDCLFLSVPQACPVVLILSI